MTTSRGRQLLKRPTGIDLCKVDQLWFPDHQRLLRTL